MKQAWIANAVWFALNGFGWASMVVRLPEVKAGLGISNATLGLVLLAAAFGVLLALQVAGKWAAARGSSEVMLFGAVSYAIAIPAVALLPGVPATAALLLFLGFSSAVMDLGMNAQAVSIEHATGKLIMGRLHGLWSVGSMAGGATGGLLASAAVPLLSHAFAVGAIILLLVLALRSRLLPAAADQHESEPEKRRTDSRPLVFAVLGVIGLAAGMGEGTALDWGAILLRDTWQATPFVAALPYIAFQTGMVIGRFNGDALATRFGRGPLLLTCGLVGGLGQASGLLIGGPVGVVLGWFCGGIGVSVVIPTVISVAGAIARKNFAGVIAPSQAVALVTGVAYSSFMFGPPVIGFTSELITLRWAMLIPAALMLLIAAGSRIAHQADA